MEESVKIKRATLEAISKAAKNLYPNEFFALLGSTKKNSIIDEIVMIPSIYGKEHASFRLDLVPVDFSIKGSVHSHPSGSNFPSRADLRVFPKTGEIHLIISYPFTINNARLFDSKGRELEWQTID